MKNGAECFTNGSVILFGFIDIGFARYKVALGRGRIVFEFLVFLKFLEQKHQRSENNRGGDGNESPFPAEVNEYKYRRSADGNRERAKNNSQNLIHNQISLSYMFICKPVRRRIFNSRNNTAGTYT